MCKLKKEKQKKEKKRNFITTLPKEPAFDPNHSLAPPTRPR